MKPKRGAQIQPLAHHSHVTDLVAAGANLIRVQMRQSEIDRALSLFGSYPFGPKYILDLHWPDSYEAIVPFWKYVAERYKGIPDLIYGICNEPPYKSTVKLMKKAVKAIREIDPVAKIAVTTKHSNPKHFRSFPFFNDPNIFYELHDYIPIKFTHQGVGELPTLEQIEEYLAPAREFQLKHKAKMLVGEFGCSIFVTPEQRFKWFRRRIKLYNKYKWSWCFHAWREHPQWSIEEDPKILTFMKKQWSKND